MAKGYVFRVAAAEKEPLTPPAGTRFSAHGGELGVAVSV